MDQSAEPNLILGLASSLAADRAKAVADLMSRSRSVDVAALSFHQRVTAILANEWRLLSSPRQPILAALASAMGDPQTDLLEVNLVAYALATAGEDGLTELLPLLSHEVFWIRAYAAEGLGSLDNSGRWAVPALIRALDGTDVPWTAYTIIRALGNIGGAQASTFLNSFAARSRLSSPADTTLLEILEGALAAARAQE